MEEGKGIRERKGKAGGKREEWERKRRLKEGKREREKKVISKGDNNVRVTFSS